MRHEHRGEYHPNWPAISDAYMAAADYRCVRCRHRFDPQTRKPLTCDARCDLTRGAHLKTGWISQATLEQLAEPTSLAARYALPKGALNYGVHHFDADKSNNRWWNLMPLCNFCHLKIQSSVIPERQWLFEHSEWAKIYVAGFYAYWFAAANPSRELVEEHIDVFLALGQPWLYPSTGYLQAAEGYRATDTDEHGEEFLRDYTRRNPSLAHGAEGPTGPAGPSLPPEQAQKLLNDVLAQGPNGP